jgi:hypothetical protein
MLVVHMGIQKCGTVGRLDRETTQAAHKLAKIFIIVVQADAGERNHHFKEGIGM